MHGSGSKSSSSSTHARRAARFRCSHNSSSKNCSPSRRPNTRRLGAARTAAQSMTPRGAGVPPAATTTREQRHEPASTRSSQEGDVMPARAFRPCLGSGCPAAIIQKRSAFSPKTCASPANGCRDGEIGTFSLTGGQPHDPQPRFRQPQGRQVFRFATGCK